MPDKMPDKIKGKKKIDKERKMSYDSLPPGTKDSLTEEEKNLFLYSEEWPDELFEKLEEFIIKK
jgi:hypothetical protein